MYYYKKTTLLLFLFVSFLFQSCDNEPIDSAIVIVETPENGSLQVNFDGQVFVSDATAATKTIVSGNATYQISGTLSGSTTKVVTLSFTENGTNTFLTGGVPFNQGGGATVSYMENISNPTAVFTSVNYANIILNTGQINVTSNDTANKLISGTFNCTVYLEDPVTGTISSSKIFSNGIFTNIHYTE